MCGRHRVGCIIVNVIGLYMNNMMINRYTETGGLTRGLVQGLFRI